MVALTLKKEAEVDYVQSASNLFDKHLILYIKDFSLNHYII